MKFINIFTLPQYISRLEKTLFIIEEKSIGQGNLNINLIKKIEDLEKKNAYLEGQVASLSKYFFSAPDKNSIEEEGPEEIEVDENFRVPIVDGIKIKFEGEDDKAARKLNVYGPGKVQTKTS